MQKYSRQMACQKTGPPSSSSATGNYRSACAHHNWLNILTAKPPSKYRVPFERLDESPLAWRIDESGEPDDMPIADPMGPVSRWQEMGEDVATSLWVKTLAEIYPDPPLIYFLENNEGARLKAKTFFFQLAGFEKLLGNDELEKKSIRFANTFKNARANWKQLILTLTALNFFSPTCMSKNTRHSPRRLRNMRQRHGRDESSSAATAVQAPTGGVPTSRGSRTVSLRNMVFQRTATTGILSAHRLI